MPRTRTRGQPLLVLIALISGWIGVRAAAWTLLDDAGPAAIAPTAQADLLPPPAGGERTRRAIAGAAPRPAAATIRPIAAPIAMPIQAPLPQPWRAEPLPGPGLAPAVPLAPLTRDVASAPSPAAPEREDRQRIMAAGGHQLLWMAAAALMPMPPSVATRLERPSQRAAALPRWSADGWVFLRGGAGPPVTFPRLSGGGTYGDSQTGMVLRYRLLPADPHRPALYLRAAGALNGTREQEVAAGLSARPLARVPIAALTEVRVTRNAQGTSARPAVALVTELPPQRLPLGFAAELYGQGGYIGGRAPTAFVDGLVRTERELASIRGAELRAGGGLWGAHQRGSSRVDVGPVASLRLRVGDTASARIEADWRFRVAGRASPGSGPALTLSAGF